MNPVRSVAWRFRTFLSQPAHDIEQRAVEREQVRETADASWSGRLDEALDRLRSLQAEADSSREESRRLFVALRTLIESQGTEIAELRREVKGLVTGARSDVGAGSGSGSGPSATAP